MKFVDSTSELERVAEELATLELLAIDTEFMREKTYYPQLCLLQLAAGQSIWCIDTLAAPDLGPLHAVLDDPRVLKVFHAGRQDMEVLLQQLGFAPRGVRDTQIAAALLGYPDQIAYAGLVEAVLDVKLDKSMSRTDWARRPLSAAQLEYAAGDVEHLTPVYVALLSALVEHGRQDWLEEESERSLSVEHLEVAPHDAWKKVKGLGGLRPRELSIAAALAAWREERAKQKNKPRNWILKDDKLVLLARHAPKSRRALSSIDGLNPGFLRNAGDALIETISGATVRDDIALAERIRLTKAGKGLMQECQRQLKLIAEDAQISPVLVSTRREIEAAVAGENNLPVYQGWRNELFGKQLRALIGAAKDGLVER